MHYPTLRQLRYLIAVSEQGHFGKAAEACFVTQSTLSAGIQELETILGATLIERTKRRVMVTPLGWDIIERAQRVMTEVEDMVVTAKAQEQPLTGLLRLGAIPTIGPFILPKVLAPLRGSYPDLRLFLREDMTATLLDQISSGALDVAVIALPYDTDAFESLVLAKDDLLLAAPIEHPLGAAAGAIDILSADLDDLMLLEDGHCLRDHVVLACGSGQDRLPRNSSRAGDAVQGTSLYTLIEMVAGGFGVTLIPEIVARAGTFDLGQLSLRPIKPEASRQIALVWRRHSARQGEFLLLGQFLRNQLALT